MTLAIRSRLTLVYTAVFGALLLAIGTASYRILAYQLDADLNENLADLTRGLHGYLDFSTGQPTLDFDSSDAEQVAFVAEATRYYQIFDGTSGELLVQSDALKPLGLDLTPAEVQSLRDSPVTMDVETDYGRLRLSNSVLTPERHRTYLLEVGVSMAPLDAALHRYLVLLLLSVPIGFLGAIVIGRWASHLALRPLTRLADIARTIHIGDLRQRLPIRHTHDELDDVAAAFNDTLSRLERSVGEMGQFSAALAHELRTPLSALRAEVELMLLQQGANDDLRPRLASQLEEIDKLKRLIARILTLASAEAGQIPLRRDPVDLSALAVSLVQQLEPVAQARQLDLRSEIVDGSTTVRGDADWLKRAVLNLVDNAIKFTPPGGRIAVAVTRGDTMARLSVRDTGIGIDPAVQPRVFTRFFRADGARSPGGDGAGLGLSLVRWIVERHDGRIDLESRPGQGATFTVHLPLARPADH